MAVVDLRALPAPDRAALRRVAARANAATDHPPLPEPQQLAVARRRGPGRRAHRGGPAGDRPGRDCPALPRPRRVDGRARGGRPDGAAGAGALAEALLGGRWRRRPGPPRSTSGSCRRPRRTTTAPLSRASSPNATCSRCASRSRCPPPWWRPRGRWRPGPSSSGATRRRGSRRTTAPSPATPNRARGRWPSCSERMAADWVELDDFLVADDPDGPGLIGACWTKVHRDRSPVLGEIYVIDVDPRHHGQGWGRSLTVAGLAHLAGTRDHRRDALHRRHQHGRRRALPLTRLHGRSHRPVVPARSDRLNA